MSKLDNIVNVNITREAQAVSIAGFGVGMVLGTHKRFNELSRSYSSMTEVGNDFSSTDLEYIACQSYFSQSPSPASVVIGKRKTNDKIIITIATATDNIDYSVIVNDTIITFSSGVGATIITIAAGLVLAINASIEPVTGIDNLDGTFDLDPDIAGVSYTFDYTEQLIVIPDYTTPDPIGDDLTAILEQDNSWYGLAITDRDVPTQLLAAAWTEGNEKLLGLASNDDDIINTTDAADTTTIAAQLKALGYARTYLMYSENITMYFPEFSLFGYTSSKIPGAYTVKFKSLPSVPVSNLTSTQDKNARDKYCNVYELIGGVNIVREGKVLEGEFIDIIIFVDWYKARIQEAVYNRLVNLAKIPYTDAGVAIIESEIKAVNTIAVTNGGLIDSTTFVTVPKVANISTNDRINRVLPDIKFGGQLSGAIHAVIPINGTVSV